MAQSMFEGQPRPSRRYRRRWSWGAVLLFALVALIAAQRGCEFLTSERALPPLEALHEGTYELVRVVDGDTLIVRSVEGSESGSDERGQARVRLLGVDTPETVQTRSARSGNNAASVACGAPV